MARQSRIPPILLTRPAAAGNAFADALRAKFGVDTRIILSPLLTFRILDRPLPEGPFAALIFTSAAGILASRGRIAAGRAWCVGDRTAAAAREAGHTVQVAGGDAAALCQAIIAAGEEGPLLHLHGRDVRGDVAARLTGAGIPTQAQVVYAQEPQPLTPEAAALLSGADPVLAPVLSPRTARLLIAERDRLTLTAPLWFAALSSAVAHGLVLRAGDRIAISERPETAALSDALAGLVGDGA
jgi:uroporphyrinogen-III synthase